jgi:hypothetical protein
MACPAAPESNLIELLATMNPVLDEETYVYCSLANKKLPSSASPLMIFSEEEGTTFIIAQSQAKDLQLSYHYPCRRITLNVYSSLEAVGFLARICTHLASRGISVNAVAAFHHDHLFVPESKAQLSMDALRELIDEEKSKAGAIQ